MHLILGIFAIIFILYFVIKSKQNYWKNKGVHFIEPNFFFGNIKDVFMLKSTEEKVLGEIYNKHRTSPYCGLYYFWRPAIMIIDPELIKKIMISDFDHFTNHPPVSSSSGTDRIVHSLFFMTDQEWKLNRSTFSKIFTPKQMKDWSKGVKRDCSKILSVMDELANGCEDLELESTIQRYTVNVITSTLFGLETDVIRNANSEFIRHGRQITNPSPSAILKSLAYLLAPGLSHRINLKIFSSTSWEFFLGLVKDVVQQRESKGFLGDDLLSFMMKLKSREIHSDIKMDLEDLVGHVYSFFVAGYDTTTLTTCYCLYELAENPEVQRKLREEVDNILKDHGDEISYEAVQEMAYMDSVISETLRKYPPGGLVKRECNKAYVDPTTGLEVSKGTMVVIPLSSIQNDPVYYPDPEKFNPDRFSSGHSLSTYFPFGKGPRMCIGMKFAEMEIKIALAMLLKRYEFLESSVMVKPLDFDPKTVFISIRPKSGLWVRVKHRDS